MVYFFVFYLHLVDIHGINACKFTILGFYGKWWLQKMNDVYCGGHDVTWYLLLRCDEIAGSVCTQKCIIKQILNMSPNCPIIFSNSCLIPIYWLVNRKFLKWLIGIRWIPNSCSIFQQLFLSFAVFDF